MQTDFMALLKGRYSCREFSPEQITDEQLATILEAARVSPSARNLQPWRLCVVQGEEGLAKVDACTKCRFGAPTVIVVAYDDEVAAHTTPAHGPEGCDFGPIDAAIAITNMESAIASLGLGSLWVGAFDPQVARPAFNVPENYRLVMFLMVGRPVAAPGPMHDKRQPLEDMLFRESF